MKMIEDHNEYLIVFLLIVVYPLLIAPYSSFAAEDFRKRAPQIEETFSTEDDVKAEVVFGRELAARILGRYTLYEDKQINRYLNMVGKGIAQNAGRPDIEFRFAVLDTNMVNAFATPGGYIFLTKGALMLMDDEAELAAVLAHEVAHVTERHIVKELGLKATEDSATSGLARILGGGTDTMRGIFSQMVDKAVELLFEKGLNRKDEIDSDRIAMIFATNAGYDPTALSRYLKKISADIENTKVLSGTHPSFEERINLLEKNLAENLLAEKKQSVVKERFRENVRIK